MGARVLPENLSRTACSRHHLSVMPAWSNPRAHFVTVRYSVCPTGRPNERPAVPWPKAPHHGAQVPGHLGARLQRRRHIRGIAGHLPRHREVQAHARAEGLARVAHTPPPESGRSLYVSHHLQEPERVQRRARTFLEFRS